MPTHLSINLNKVALLRNQRDCTYPSPVLAGQIILEAGANGLTVHPRPDQRHIRTHDVYDIAALVKEPAWKKRGIEYNIEGYPGPEFLELVCTVQPDQVTLVPDGPHARTSDSGWKLEKECPDDLIQAVKRLKKHSMRVALFMDCTDDDDLNKQRMEKVKSLGADRIELYTGPFAYKLGFGAIEAGTSRPKETPATAQQLEQLGKEALEPVRMTADRARELGLGLNAGHDLSLDNLPFFTKGLSDIQEVSIGHAFTADALMHGYKEAVRLYRQALTT